ncbi:signal peptidase I [Salinicoccus roseus]|uniref:signal peptidase I n=1 Tax=Salinicoccus roseus TaxID=45670 RepID=UPI001CA61D61|nr:signal peptidase I [Salinicoccus roseus]MBY8909251.1 signal peptidase I [Salinicoccus roseus]
MKKEIGEWLVAILIAVVLIVLIRSFLFVSYTVDGLSMDPTFEDEDRVVVNKLMDNFGEYETGDVVVFNSEAGPAYVKRIIGTPGDTVTMEDKQVYVNGEPLEEDYVVHRTDSYMDNFTLQDLGVEGETIPEGQYLVLGDNRPLSRDSRDFGTVDESQIIGEVQLRFWPFNRIAVNFD